MYNNPCVFPVQSEQWYGGTYYPCTLTGNRRNKNIHKNIKNNKKIYILLILLCQTISCSCSLFTCSTTFVLHWLSCFSPVDYIAGSHLSPLPCWCPFLPESWPETLETLGTVGQIHAPARENTCLTLQLHLYIISSLQCWNKSLYQSCLTNFLPFILFLTL